MYVYFLAAAYLAINVCIWLRICQLITAIMHKATRRIALVVFTLLYLFFFTSMISWTLFEDENIVHFLKYISNVWTGIFIYTLLFWGLAELVALVHFILRRRATKKTGVQYPHSKRVRLRLVRTASVTILVALFSLYGVVHAENIKLETYDLTTEKGPGSGTMRIALISDFHLGYSVGDEQMKRMVRLINQQDVDLVCIAGDIVDNDYDAILEPEKISKTLARIKSKYGVYGVYGNHDVEEKLVGGFSLYSQDHNIVQTRVDDMMKASDITILQDQVVQVCPGVTLIGRIDGEKPNERVLAGGQRKSIEELTGAIDKDQFIIDLDHEPDQLAEKAAAGVDLDLGGHTHDGQIFPGNLIMKLIWDNPCGQKEFGSMQSIVTSGVGLWGPAMRVATDAQVVIINVTFK